MTVIVVDDGCTGVGLNDGHGDRSGHRDSYRFGYGNRVGVRHGDSDLERKYSFKTPLNGKLAGHVLATTNKLSWTVT